MAYGRQIRRLVCNPMFHVSQVPRVHTSALKGGYLTYVMRRFELEPWLANIGKYQISELNIVRVSSAKHVSEVLLC